VDREESLIHLLRVNVLKRMESSVVAFALTVERQLRDVEATLARIEAQAEDLDEIDIEDVDIEDPAFESLLVGRKVKVLVQDVDLVAAAAVASVVGNRRSAPWRTSSPRAGPTPWRASSAASTISRCWRFWWCLPAPEG
jgi:hypothetical protein